MADHTDAPQDVKPTEENPASIESHENSSHSLFDGVRESGPEKVAEARTIRGSQPHPLSDTSSVPNVFLTNTSVVNTGDAALDGRTTPESKASLFELVFCARGKPRPHGPKKAPKRKCSSGIISDPSRPTPPSVAAGTVKASARPSRPKRDT